MTNCRLTFTLKRTLFDEDYCPAEHTRLTTNFANLARGASRRENLRNTLRMIDNRFNSLAHWDNPRGDRYSIELDIISIGMIIHADEDSDAFPLIEMLQTTIVDKVTQGRFAGIVGNNFSSYVRDYDFSVVLPGHIEKHPGFGPPEDFGDLHGKLFRHFINSDTYRDAFENEPVICLSVSSNKTYRRTGNYHPILGLEYQTEEFSPTDDYFGKMGMKVRYFMPLGSVAPFAFYHVGDLLGDFTNAQLISTISTMETFQKIYRPEIYNANSVAAERYRPSLKHQDYSLTRIVYDRDERNSLAFAQGKFAEGSFIRPYQDILEEWAANFSANRLSATRLS